ncbi:stemmadenine O-acetyltransferase-like [Mangifera indica]|uniref:stemmadenine O-acetyltransferase-like n=1 Tax=Mangifera indica TaxID=29780 RepID=UPI001CFB501E|nr:stemmadenine O-acetyltransferase-like [Mangifera indica]
MEIEVEVISKETVKPSSPTPHHLHHYQFSFPDQLSPSVYIPLIYYYDILDHKLGNSDVFSNLKSSLSKVLCHYYPLAGCLKHNYVDCNDDGVVFLKAQVSCQLSQFIQEPLLTELNKFLPYDRQKQYGLENSVLAIQVNFFNCGSFAIGVLISHKIADASSMITFIKNWAATARGESANFCPQFVSAILFPPKDVGGLSSTEAVPTKENIVMKRFVFSGYKIAALREKYSDKPTLEDNKIHPTRVEVLSSFIWSRFAASTGTKIGFERPYMLVQAVNLRKRMHEPLPDDSFGNIAGPSGIIVSEDSESKDVYSLIRKFRNAISKINGDYVMKLQAGAMEDFGFSVTNDERLNKAEMVNFWYSSLCRFPVYEADFGWGRPIWIAWGGLPYRNLVTLMDTKDGDGIEAWVHMTEEDMAKFENDHHLLSYLSPTSNP